MNFKIPKKFQLGGITINVEKVKQISGEGNNVDGKALYANSKIELKEDKEYSNEYKEFVFFHELVHHIFNSLEEYELRKNEKIVSQFATFLHQAIKTME